MEEREPPSDDCGDDLTGRLGGYGGKRSGTDLPVVRNTNEILFFITPRIYRPDYQGRRIEVEPTTGTHSVTLPQPVPLGNPSTNTPAPTQQNVQPQSAPSAGPAAEPSQPSPQRP